VSYECLFEFDEYISIGVDLPVRILDVRLGRLARELVIGYIRVV
jgi:hypothetical protein